MSTAGRSDRRQPRPSDHLGRVFSTIWTPALSRKMGSGVRWVSLPQAVSSATERPQIDWRQWYADMTCPFAGGGWEGLAWAAPLHGVAS